MKITLGNRLTEANLKENKPVYIRYRIRDGRDINLYYSSSYKVNSLDLNKFNDNFTPKSIIDYSSTLLEEIKQKINLITQVYEENKPKTSEELTSYINTHLSILEENNNVEKIKISLLSYINLFKEKKENRNKAQSTIRHYSNLIDEIGRFLYFSGKGAEFEVKYVDRDFIESFSYFLRNEEEFMKKNTELYENRSKLISNKGPATTNNFLKQLSYILKSYSLNDRDYSNPFDFNKEDFFIKEDEHYAYSLTVTQLWDLYNVIVWKEKENKRNYYKLLEKTRRIFLLQCMLGVRDSDYRLLKDENIGSIKTASGKEIFYIMYKSKKTGSVISTPLIDEAKEIIDSFGGLTELTKQIPTLKNYNNNIRKILEEMQFTCITPHLKDGQIVQNILLSEVASSKLARCTFVTLTAEYSVNLKASGLHQSTEAASHYFHKSIYKQYINFTNAFHDNTDNEFIDDTEANLLERLPKIDYSGDFKLIK